MASKVEISEVESLIEEHREANPLFANGLITALNVLLDEPIPLIEIAPGEEGSDLVGDFSWALDQVENHGKRVVMNCHKDAVLSFENNAYWLTSSGREQLTEFPFYMIKGLNWKLASKK